MAARQFGEVARGHRTKREETLRAFCKRTGLDPAYTSKVERGILAPPQDPEKLESYARSLGLVPDSEEWSEFMDLAALAAGRLPHDVITNDSIMGSLPAFLRTARGEQIDEDQLKELIDMIKGRSNG